MAVATDPVSKSAIHSLRLLSTTEIETSPAFALRSRIEQGMDEINNRTTHKQETYLFSLFLQTYVSTL